MVEIDKKLEKEINSLSKEQFWYWVSRWDDIETIIEDTFNWDLETKKEAIKEMEKIKKGFKW